MKRKRGPWADRFRNKEEGIAIMLKRPANNDYAEYFEPYVRLVPDGDLMDVLEALGKETFTRFAGLDDGKAMFCYAPGKWSIKELLGHISDTERVMSYRLLRAARGDTTPLPGFDENLFVQGASSNLLPLGALLEEFATVRKSTLSLLRTLPAEAWSRRGIVGGRETTPLALACILAGHEIHHRNVLVERYLSAL